jgi:ketosteroid isomerase-like protein
MTLRLGAYAPASFGATRANAFAAGRARRGIRMSSDAQDLIATIERAFVAIGEDDPMLRRQIFSEDFHAFENGRRMTGPEVFELMSRYRAQGRRYEWSVNSPQIEVQGDLGVVIYVNRGSITESAGADPLPMSWLETAVFRRQDSSWRLAFLHSTRMPCK